MSRKLRDRTGQTCGFWTVLRRDGQKYPVRWICRCICGVEKSVRAGHLSDGTPSCGCRGRGYKTHQWQHTIYGQRFSRLLALGPGTRKNNRPRIRCICDCGNETNVSLQALKRGEVASCGCLRRELNRLAFGEAMRNGLRHKYKKRAADRGYEWEISDEQFDKLTQLPCHYCGAPPSNVFHQPKAYGETVYNGIDRRDNDKGYTTANCVPCCTICNQTKSDLTETEFVAWLDRLTAFQTVCRS